MKNENLTKISSYQMKKFQIITKFLNFYDARSFKKENWLTIFGKLMG